MRIFSLFVVLCCLLATASAVAAESKAVVFKEDNDKAVVDVKVGQSFSVELVANPSTGHDWHVVNLDSSMLSLAEQEFRPPTGKLVGAPGVAVWRFTALAMGATKLQLAYYRSWEGSGTASKLFTLELRIGRAE